MKAFLAVIPASILLAACSSTPSDLESKAAPVVQTYTENYQEIFRRVSTTAKRCYSANMGAYASTTADTQLYPDLGYGEISVSLINMGTRNYYMTAKIEKNGTGAKMTVQSGNTLAAPRYIEYALKWAGGATDCPTY